ncbi:hypothetical protein KBA27_04090 [bacterium]|nr:hypothetical protein [bacterium]
MRISAIGRFNTEAEKNDIFAQLLPLDKNHEIKNEGNINNISVRYSKLKNNLKECQKLGFVQDFKMELQKLENEEANLIGKLKKSAS